MKLRFSILGFVAGTAALVACSSGAPDHTDSTDDDLIVCSPGLLKTPRAVNWTGERVVGTTSVIVPLRRIGASMELAVVDAKSGAVSKRVVVASRDVARFLDLNGSERCTQYAPVPPPPAPWCPPDAHGREVCPETCLSGQLVTYARASYCTNDAVRLGMIGIH